MTRRCCENTVIIASTMPIVVLVRRQYLQRNTMFSDDIIVCEVQKPRMQTYLFKMLTSILRPPTSFVPSFASFRNADTFMMVHVYVHVQICKIFSIATKKKMICKVVTQRHYVTYILHYLRYLRFTRVKAKLFDNWLNYLTNCVINVTVTNIFSLTLL